MSDIESMLQSPAWWFGVILVGLILSVLGVFLADALKYIYQRMILWLSKTVSQRRVANRRHIVMLSRHPDLLRTELLLCLIQLIKPVFFCVMMILCISMVLFKGEHADSGISMFQISTSAQFLPFFDKTVALFTLLTLAVQGVAFIFASNQAWLLAQAYDAFLSRMIKGKPVA